MAAEKFAGGQEGGRWCVVTGGRGFAARHLVEMLLRSEENWRVRITDLAPEIKLDPHELNGILAESLSSGRAAYASADLRRKLHVIRAFQGVEVVFHMAAPDSSINNYQLHYSVNVEGTKNVIDACIECKVKRLVYTSSPSVVFDGVHGIHIGIETLPYPSKFNDSYSETKAEGEKLVKKASGHGGLLTCCIRPSSIFGPGDKLMVPSLVAAAKAGKSKFIIGDGNNFYDFTYVENVAYAHVRAERTLASGGADKVGGQAFFITNMEPIKFWEFMSRILEGLGYERPRVKIPASLMMPIARMVEWAYKIFGPYGMPVPQLTPSRVRLLSCNRTFSSSKAEDQLGYKPIVSLEEGIRRTIESFSHLRSEKEIVRESSAPYYLSSIKALKMHVKREKKQNIAIMLLLATLYYYLFASGYTAITASAKLLSLVSLFLFIHGMLPEQILGYRILKMPPSYFHLSEENSHYVAHSITSSWNQAASDLKSLCKGKDLTIFLKVFFALSVLSFLGSMSPKRIFEIGVPLVFISLYFYDKRESEIDELFDEVVLQLSKLKLKLVEKLHSD